MNKRINRDSYVLIVIIAVAVLAVSSFVFTKYLEDQTLKTVEASTYLSLPSTSQSQVVRVEETTTATTQAVPGVSSANEILQLLAESVNDENQIEANFRKFRNGQLEDNSLEEYQLYVRLLKAIFGQKIESYSTMSYTERMSTIEEMQAHDPTNETFLRTASFHWLESRDSSGDVNRIPILLSQDAEGQSYLSREWVRSCLELRNYATLYFGAVLEENTEAVERLTYSLSSDRDILQQKTSALLNYYRNTVQAAEVGSAEIISLRMDQITFRIPIHGQVRNESLPVEATALTTAIPESSESEELVSNSVKQLPTTSGGASPEATPAPSEPSETTTIPSEEPVPNETRYHEVTIFKRNGAFIAQDVVPATNWLLERPVMQNGEPILALRTDYSVADVSRLFGFPERQLHFTSSGGDGQSADYLRLVYPDLELVLTPSAVTEDQYTLLAIKLTTQRYSLGDFRVGTSLQRLYQTYLYMDTLQFRYVDEAGNTVYLTLGDTQQISQIEIQDEEYRADLLLQEQGPDEEVEVILPTPTPIPTPVPSPETSASETLPTES